MDSQEYLLLPYIDESSDSLMRNTQQDQENEQLNNNQRAYSSHSSHIPFQKMFTGEKIQLEKNDDPLQSQWQENSMKMLSDHQELIRQDKKTSKPPAPTVPHKTQLDETQIGDEDINLTQLLDKSFCQRDKSGNLLDDTNQKEEEQKSDYAAQRKAQVSGVEEQKAESFLPIKNKIFQPQQPQKQSDFAIVNNVLAVMTRKVIQQPLEYKEMDKINIEFTKFIQDTSNYCRNNMKEKEDQIDLVFEAVQKFEFSYYQDFIRQKRSLNTFEQSLIPKDQKYTDYFKPNFVFHDGEYNKFHLKFTEVNVYLEIVHSIFEKYLLDDLEAYLKKNFPNIQSTRQLSCISEHRTMLEFALTQQSGANNRQKYYFIFKCGVHGLNYDLKRDQIIGLYEQLDVPKFQQLADFLLYWGHQRGIVTRKYGDYLSEKAILFMVIAYLQWVGLLPILEDKELAKQLRKVASSTRNGAVYNRKELKNKIPSSLYAIQQVRKGPRREYHWEEYILIFAYPFEVNVQDGDSEKSKKKSKIKEIAAAWKSTQQYKLIDSELNLGFLAVKFFQVFAHEYTDFAQMRHHVSRMYNIYLISIDGENITNNDNKSVGYGIFDPVLQKQMTTNQKPTSEGFNTVLKEFRRAFEYLAGYFYKELVEEYSPGMA